jgi:hypothetical protein
LHTPGETGDSTKGALEKAGSGRAREKDGAVFGQVGEATALLFRGRHRWGLSENRLVHACFLEVGVVSRETRIPFDALTHTIPRQDVPSVTLRFTGESVVKAAGSIRISV